MDGGCVTAVYETRIETPNTGEGGKGRRSLSRIRMEQEDLNLYMNIITFKEKVKGWGAKRVAVCETERNWDKIKGMMEHIFCGEDIQVIAYTSGEVREAQKGGRRKVTEAEHKKTKEKRNRGWETEAVVVSATNKNYEDLVRKVKANVDVHKLGVKIRNIRSTRQGDLLLTLEDKNGAGRLEEEINETLGKGGINARKGGERTVVVHVKGLDITATAGDVKEAILNKYNTPDAQVIVKAIRPAFGMTQNATVILPVEIGEKLTSEGKIRIGWTVCKANKRVELTRCTRCWLIGHTRRDCRGPDRTNMCLRCAEEGHQVKDCTNGLRCPVCDTEGHRADSSKWESSKAYKEGKAISMEKPVLRA